MVLVGVRVLIGCATRRDDGERHRQPCCECRPEAHELNVLIVGVSRLTEAYIQAVAEFGSGRVNVAGIVGRHVGRLVASYPVLGLPEDIESVLDSLEVHRVAIDRIVVTVPFGDLSEEVQEAFLAR